MSDKLHNNQQVCVDLCEKTHKFPEITQPINIFSQMIEKQEKKIPPLAKEKREGKIVLIHLSVEKLKTKIEQLKKIFTNQDHDLKQSYKIIIELKRQCENLIQESELLLEDIEQENNIFSLPSSSAEHDLKKAFNVLLDSESDIKFLKNMIDVFEEKNEYSLESKRLKQQKKELDIFYLGEQEKTKAVYHQQIQQIKTETQKQIQELTFQHQKDIQELTNRYQKEISEIQAKTRKREIQYWGMKQNIKLLLQDIKKYEVFERDMKKKKVQIERECLQLKKQLKENFTYIEKQKIHMSGLEQKNKVLKNQLIIKEEEIQEREISISKIQELETKRQQELLQNWRVEKEGMKKKIFELEKAINIEKERYQEREVIFEKSIAALKEKGEDDELHLLQVIKRVKDEKNDLSKKVEDQFQIIQGLRSDLKKNDALFQEQIEKMTKNENLLQDEIMMNTLQTQKLLDENKALNQHLKDRKKRLEEETFKFNETLKNYRQIQDRLNQKLEKQIALRNQQTDIENALNSQIKFLEQVCKKQNIEIEKLTLDIRNEEETCLILNKLKNKAVSDLEESKQLTKKLQVKYHSYEQNLLCEMAKRAKIERENQQLIKNIEQIKKNSEKDKNSLHKLEGDYMQSKARAEEQKYELSGSISSLTRENQIIKAKNRSLEDLFSSHQQSTKVEIQALRKDIGILTQSNNELSHSLEATRNSEISLQKQVKILSSELIQNSSECKNLSQKLAVKSQLAGELEYKVYDLESSLTKKEKEGKKKEKQLSEQKKKLEQYLQLIENIETKLKKSEKSETTLREVLQIHESSFAQIRFQYTILEQKLGNLTEQHKKIKADNTCLTQKYQNTLLSKEKTQEQLKQMKQMYLIGVEKYDLLSEKHAKVEIHNLQLSDKIEELENRVKLYDEEEQEEFQRIQLCTDSQYGRN